MYNMMTCGGWVDGFSILGSCSMAWFSFAIIVFLALIAKRQCTDGILAGTGFNIIGAFVLGIGAHVIITSIFGSARWALVGGILGVAIGGYLLGLVMDTTGGGEDYGG